MKSILLVDCGNTTNTAVLIEQQQGRYRLTAAGQAFSTYAEPWNDITVGVQQAMRHVEKSTGRMLLAPGGWPFTPQNGQQGVDAFGIVSSVGLPLQVAVAGLMADVSLASAERALATTYSQPLTTISLDQQTERSVEQLQAAEPDLILLVGGTDGGAEGPIIELAQLISMALQVGPQAAPPTVLFAGNRAVRPQIADILGPISALKSINNIQPGLDIEDVGSVRLELEAVYLQRNQNQLPGFERLANWTQQPIMPANQSFEKLIAYLGQQTGINVLGVDVGSQNTVLVAYSDGQLVGQTGSEAGLGHGLASLLTLVAIEDIRRWLPYDITPEEFDNQLLNKCLYPTSLPTTEAELHFEQAIAREAMRQVKSHLPQGLLPSQWSSIIATGRVLTGAPQAAQTVLTLLDALEPWGVTTLMLDQSGVVPMVGLLAAIEPEAAVQIVEQDALLNLATVVAPRGRGQVGQRALTLTLTSDEGDSIEREVMVGSIVHIPLPAGQRATVEIEPARNFDIGLGGPGQGAETDIEGGLLGLIVDARGRPLRLPTDDEARLELLQQWLTAITG